MQDRLCQLILSRPSSTSPAAAIRGSALDSVEGIRRYPGKQWCGELGYLSAISPTVHRLALEVTDRQAAAVAAAISASSPVKPEIARIQGMALLGVFQLIISEAGQRTRRGQSQAKIADELKPIIENVIDELDRWFSAD